MKGRTISSGTGPSALSYWRGGLWFHCSLPSCSMVTRSLLCAPGHTCRAWVEKQIPRLCLLGHCTPWLSGASEASAVRGHEWFVSRREAGGFVGSSRSQGHEDSTNQGAFGREHGLRSLWEWSLPSCCFAKQHMTASNLNAAFLSCSFGLLILPQLVREERKDTKARGEDFLSGLKTCLLPITFRTLLAKSSLPPPPITGPVP